MKLRVAELTGSVIFVASGVVLVWSLAFDPAFKLSEFSSPIRHFTEGTAGRAFEDQNTARLALARFPIPIDGNTGTAAAENLIKVLQIDLARHGLDVGPANGVATPKTREAIAEYQRQMGLEITGKPSRLLRDHLSMTQPLREASADRQSGERIRLVASVQKKLANLGYSVSKPSGIVTDETRDAIAKFERDTGLPVTGEVSFKLVQLLKRIKYTPL